ncbi:tryptorubin family RiPP precursor [Streptomyces sp. NPDC001380]|uniref:tryptorubin family RiPP precursor n=1 Tax=Streptomyces sp. NPDC001380 TaxID=3364566 RepID=UPI00367CB99C
MSRRTPPPESGGPPGAGWGCPHPGVPAGTAPGRIRAGRAGPARGEARAGPADADGIRASAARDPHSALKCIRARRIRQDAIRFHRFSHRIHDPHPASRMFAFAAEHPARNRGGTTPLCRVTCITIDAWDPLGFTRRGEGKRSTGRIGKQFPQGSPSISVIRDDRRRKFMKLVGSLKKKLSGEKSLKAYAWYIWY